ncbi:MAG: lipid-A-disaccharide synthase [Planctomycetes bacterium]|nr:lipid-A-disaccharide synthase [Planctomycetota bacterium]
MHIFFSVGEPSGDLHASKLVSELKRRVPGLKCSGFGGPLMQEAGCDILFRLTDLAVMGILPVIPLIFKFLRLVREARQYLTEHRPDAVVLVDFPGFNWLIAKTAKKLGIRVIYYLPPQLWAWAPWRIRKVRKYVDQLLSPLPFEVQWYRDRSVAAEFVGHPFFDEVAGRKLDREFMHAQTSLAGPATRTIAILPGSRNHEIQQNFAIQLRVMRELHRRVPQVRYLVASYKDAQRERCEALWKQHAPELPITFHVGQTSEILEISEMCLMVSGSVSLEVLARHTPAIVLYRINRAFYWLCEVLITCKYFSLPNLIADHPIMPEFAPIDDPRQSIATMAALAEHWLTDAQALAAQRTAMEQVCTDIASSGATGKAADAILRGLPTETAEPSRIAA